MSFDPRDPNSSSPSDPSDAPRQPPRGGSQGASRGGQQPDAPPGGRPDSEWSNRPGWSPSGGRTGSFGSWLPRGGSGGSRTFLGLPVALIYVIAVVMISFVFLGAVCSRPVRNGSVAGQVKALSEDRQVSTLSGAQVILRGVKDTYTTVSSDAPADATGESAYNYRFENVPPGKYTMAVTPPAGSNLQPEDNVTLEVESGELFPQSVMLLAQGIQKPRPLSPSELEPGQTGYINDRGERVTYQQGSGFDATDALLLYLLWRNPPAYGYGAPPVIISSPGSSTTTSSSNYRVDPPPSTAT